VCFSNEAACGILFFLVVKCRICMTFWMWQNIDTKFHVNIRGIKLVQGFLICDTLYYIYEGQSNENLKYFLSWTIWCGDPWLISRCAIISFTVMQRCSFTMASTVAMASGVTTRCARPGQWEFVTELMPFMNLLVHSYTCCSDRHASPYWTFIHRWILMGFTSSLLKNS